ncbi:hypothetical protein FQN60_005085, partial [Etheostoma spectabile]
RYRETKGLRSVNTANCYTPGCSETDYFDHSPQSITVLMAIIGAINKHTGCGTPTRPFTRTADLGWSLQSAVLLTLSYDALVFCSLWLVFIIAQLSLPVHSSLMSRLSLWARMKGARAEKWTAHLARGL